MVILVKIIALWILAVGVLFLVNPKMLKNYVSFWARGSRISIGAGINLIVGIVFLMAAQQCKVGLVITIMGIISLVKGIVLFASGQEKAKAMVNKWAGKPQGVVRLLGLLAIGIGMLLLWSI